MYQKREKPVGPKYSAGSKVRIKSRDLPGKILAREISSYENMVGEILDATSAVAFLGSPSTRITGGSERITIYEYTVRINEQVTLFDVAEDYLEILQ